MADLERFGGELFLNANQYIATVGQVASSNIRLESSLQKVGNSVSDMGLKFNAGIQGAEKFGKLIDNSGRIVAGYEAIHTAIDGAVTKFDQLATSGRQSHQALYDSLLKVKSAEDTYKNAIDNVFRALVKEAEAGADDIEAKERLNKAVRTAENIYRSYLKAVQNVGKANEAVKREDAAIIASYQLLGQRLQQTTTFINRLKYAWDGFISKIAGVRGAVSSVIGSFGGMGAGAQQASGLLGVLGKAAGLAGVALSAIGKAAKVAASAFGLLLSPLKKAIDSLRDFFRTASQVAVGILIRDTIRGIVRELRELAFAGFEAVKFFQALEIRLDLMELRALRAEGATGSLNDMMNMASERAQRLTYWIKELSLTSPFSVDTLATVTSLNLAMGFTEDMAKRLTIAISNYTAGMGLSNQVMERIVFNFGQMKSAGKVTATEMRDLARGAFLPLTDVLDEAAHLMGVTTDNIMEFRKAAAAGEVDVDTFFRAFINVVERDFGDAAERFSRTLEGVKNRLTNFFKTVIGLEVLGPIAKRVAEVASNALDKIMTTDTITRARVLGETLLRAFDQIAKVIHGRLLPALSFLWRALGIGKVTFESIALAVAKFTYWMEAAIRFVSQVIDDIADYFYNSGDRLIDRMHTYGYNIVAFFAKGMAAAVNLVVRVLTWIGNAISSLLKTHSPPKLLPKLPQWGMDAMTEYLKGFTLADFDVLEGIQDPIKDALDILEETGKIGENQAGKIYAQISKTIAKALSTGKIDESLFKNIAEVTGPFGEQIAELARRQIELAAATEAVRKAEQRLEDARKAHEASRVKTNKLIREYNASLRAGASSDYLKAKLKEINASEEASRAAYEEQKAAEADLEQKEKNVDIISELLEKQDRLVSQLLELTKAQIVQPVQPEVETGGAGEELPTTTEALPELPPLPAVELPDEEDIKNQIDSIFATAQAEVEAQIQKLKEAWEQSGLGTAFTNLGTAWSNAWTTITTFYDEKVQPILDRIKEWWTSSGWPSLSLAFSEFGESVSDVWESLKGTFERIGELFDNMGLKGIELEDVLNLIVNFIGGILAAVATVITIIAALIAGIYGGLMGAWAAMQPFFQVVQFGIDMIREAFENFEWSFSGVIDFLRTLVVGLVTTIAGLIGTVLGAIGGFLAGFFMAIVDFFTGLWNKLVGHSIIPDMMDDIWDAVTQPIEDLVEWWNEQWGKLVDFWENDLKPAIEELWNQFLELKDNVVSYLRELLEGKLEDFRKFIQETIPTAWDTFKTKVNEVWSWFEEHIIQPIADFISEELADLKEMFDTTLTNAINTFRTVVLDPLTTGFDTLKTAVSNLWTWIGNLKDKLLAFPYKLLELLSGQSPSPLAIGIDYAAKSMKNMAKNALPQLNRQLMLTQAMVSGGHVVNAPAVMQAAGTTNSVSVQMGGVNISSGMDEALFEARVLEVVRRGLRG